MAESTFDVSYRTIHEIEAPDLWDQYEQTACACKRAYQRPREMYGIKEQDDGKFLMELRIVDPKGESLAEIRRCRTNFLRATDALNRGLRRLHEGWNSDAIFDRIICFTNEAHELILESLSIALSRMEATNHSLRNLESLLESPIGFKMAIELIVKTATPQARSMLAEVSKQAQGDAGKLVLLNDAAVAMAVKLNDVRAIPLLVNRLTKAYANASSVETTPPQRATRMMSQPTEIVEGLLSVVHHNLEELHPQLLHQLVRLGAVSRAIEEGIAPNWQNSKLGISQAIITRDLQPVRDAALHELQRRKIAS